MLNLKENSFLKNVSILFVGTFVSQLINVGGLPILSRMYGTEEFAMLGVFMAIGLITLSFSTLQLDLAIVRTPQLKVRLALIKSAFMVTCIVAILVSMVGIFLVESWYEDIRHEFSYVLFFYLIANSGNQILVYFFNSENKYTNIALVRILLSAINLFLAIVLFFLLPDLGLIIAITVANCISLLLLIAYFKKNISKTLQISFSECKKIVLKNIQFIKYSTPSSFLDILSHQLIIIFLVKYFDKEIAGSFFMSMRIILLPAGLLGYAIGQVFYKKISDKYSNRDLSVNIFLKLWQRLFLVGIIPFLIIFLFGKDIFEWVFGGEWILAGEMATILAFKGFVNFWSSPTSSGFVVINQQRFNLQLTSIRIIYTVILLFISIQKQDIFYFILWYTVMEVIHMLSYNLLMLYRIHLLRTS